MTARERYLEPGEYFLGGKGVVIFRGFKKRPGIILPSRSTKSSWCNKYMSIIGGV